VRPYAIPWLRGNRGAGGSCALPRMDAAPFRLELGLSAALQRLLKRYLYVVMGQLAQTTACTRFHSAVRGFDLVALEGGQGLAWLTETSGGARLLIVGANTVAHVFGRGRVWRYVCHRTDFA